MIAIQIEDEFLDMFPDAAVDIQLQSPVFSDAQRSFIPGNYSFPFRVPTTQKNRRLLNYPDFLQVDSDNWDLPTPAVLLFDSKAFFKGSLFKRSTTSDSYIEVYFTSGLFNDIKDINLNQIDMGKVTLDDDINAWIAYANDTASDPTDYPVIFFPVNNPEMYEEDKKPALPYKNVQNQYDYANSTFSLDTEVTTPFVRVSHAIDKIFEYLNVTVENYFTNAVDLNKLVLYNNQSVDLTNDKWPTELTISDHLPPKKAGDWLKSITRLFGIVVFQDPFLPECSMVAIKDLVAKEATEDWSEVASVQYTIQKTSEAPYKYKHKEYSNELAWIFRAPHIKDIVPTADLTYQTYWEMQTDWTSQSVGQIIYVKNIDIYYLVLGASSYGLLYRRYQPITTGAKNTEVFENDLYPLRQHASILTPDNTDSELMMPSARYRCNIPHLEQHNDCPEAITIYRGLRNYTTPVTFNLYPFAHSDISYLEGGYEFDTISLRWDTEYGLYNIWHKDFFERCLRHYTEIRWKVKLSISDLLRFSFQNVIRIGTVNYLVKSLQIRLTASGLSDADVTLVQIRG